MDDGSCECDDDAFKNCKQVMTRECKPASHYNEDRGSKWSIDATISCEGKNITEETCSVIYDKWETWTSCDKSCVNKDEQSIRTRQRSCNDTIISSGILMLKLIQCLRKNIQRKNAIWLNQLKWKFATRQSAKNAQTSIHHASV